MSRPGSISVSAATYERLREESRKRGVSIAQLVEQAVFGSPRPPELEGDEPDEMSEAEDIEHQLKVEFMRHLRLLGVPS